MCTVTFIPTGHQSFILTSNRDENPDRETGIPSVGCAISEEEYLIFPKDEKAGGTWIAMSPQNRMVCLLNGAFTRHQHQPPYRKSRGLVALDYFRYKDAKNFVETYDFNQIEPFTLIMAEPGKLWEFRWDGNKKHLQEMDSTGFHIWSSATLYTTEVAQSKEKAFRNWLEAKNYQVTPEEIQQFHGLKNRGGYLLDLPMVKTVSITCVVNEGTTAEMIYNDLAKGSRNTRKIRFTHQQEPF